MRQQSAIDGADAGANDAIKAKALFVQRLKRANLERATRAAAFEHQTKHEIRLLPPFVRSAL